jgi:hypothetical protein
MTKRLLLWTLKTTDNCNGKVTYFLWKRTFDKIVCCASALVLSSLLFAIIVPLVFHQLEVDGIKEEVVVDGKDAPAYDIWQSGDKPEIHYDVIRRRLSMVPSLYISCRLSNWDPFHLAVSCYATFYG